MKDITWGDSVTLPTPVKAGAKFEGWYTSKDYTTQFTEKDFVTDDMTLYAKWNGEAGAIITPAGGNKGPSATPTVMPSITPVLTPTGGAEVTPTGGAEDSNKKTVESITAEYIGKDAVVGSAIEKDNIMVTATYSDGHYSFLMSDFIKSHNTHPFSLKFIFKFTQDYLRKYIHIF